MICQLRLSTLRRSCSNRAGSRVHRRVQFGRADIGDQRHARADPGRQVSSVRDVDHVCLLVSGTQSGETNWPVLDYSCGMRRAGQHPRARTIRPDAATVAVPYDLPLCSRIRSRPRRRPLAPAAAPGSRALADVARPAVPDRSAGRGHADVRPARQAGDPVGLVHPRAVGGPAAVRAGKAAGRRGRCGAGRPSRSTRCCAATSSGPRKPPARSRLRTAWSPSSTRNCARSRPTATFRTASRLEDVLPPVMWHGVQERFNRELAVGCVAVLREQRRVPAPGGHRRRGHPGAAQGRAPRDRVPRRRHQRLHRPSARPAPGHVLPARARLREPGSGR